MKTSWTIEMHDNFKSLQKSFNTKHNSGYRFKIWFDSGDNWYLKYHNHHDEASVTR